MQAFDVQVSGAGIVGKALSLSLARLGLSVALRGAPAATGRDDVRAYALNAASIDLLRRLKVWDALGAGATTAVHDMVVQGDASAGRLEFSAWEQCVGELAVI
ncbi:MAG: 2-octaprenyl-3-methyl-6-methoxy-1,4-benzoquinol hydroxylase, partial [Pseudomonadota bacterium]|nr:2-octaprenyl-3-methyl-6-methoxy-1,4-benzoquinol hydroxylase [Pseudomonadota bacterium]